MFLAVRHLVQQEEAERRVDRGPDIGRGVGLRYRHLRQIADLSLAVGNLDGGDVDDVEMAVGADPVGQTLDEIAVDVGHHEHPLAGRDLVQRRAHQPPCIAEQQHVDDDRPVEQGDITRVHVRPIVDFLHIGGDRQFGGHRGLEDALKGVRARKFFYAGREVQWSISSFLLRPCPVLQAWSAQKGIQRAKKKEGQYTCSIKNTASPENVTAFGGNPHFDHPQG